MTLVRRRASTAADLKALGHPVRLDVLDLLLDRGPLTATEAGRLLGQSPANVSWHLRTLAAAGFVRSSAVGPGRQRPWKAVIEAFDDGDPPPAYAPGAEVSIERDAQALSRAARAEPGSVLRSQHSLRLTDEEARSLAADIEAVVTAYRESTGVTAAPRRERTVLAWIAPAPLPGPK